MVLQGLPPGMEYCGDADLGAEMAWIGGDGGKRLGRGAEQDCIDSRGDAGARDAIVSTTSLKPD